MYRVTMQTKHATAARTMLAALGLRAQHQRNGRVTTTLLCTPKRTPATPPNAYAAHVGLALRNAGVGAPRIPHIG
jgi:hypothetical protein